MTIILAHLSDVHLAPLPVGALFQDFAPKRLIGGFNWLMRRKACHLRVIADALADDIKALQPDHVAFTGDLVNIAAASEYQQGAAWLNRFGDGQWISFVPGNHDAYVMMDWQRGLAQFSPYMTGSMTVPGAATSSFNQAPFPYVRFRGNVALLGLSSAEPQSLRRAAGRLGPKQLAATAGLLHSLKQKGYFRVIMIHHPPLPGLCAERKALTDAAAFRDMIAIEGAELILHGHNHRNMENYVDTENGPVPVIGVSSASMRAAAHHEPASWNLIKISRQAGHWRTEVINRVFDPRTTSFYDGRQYHLTSSP